MNETACEAYYNIINESIYPGFSDFFEVLIIILGVIVAVVILWYENKSGIWLLVGICCFSSSLGWLFVGVIPNANRLLLTKKLQGTLQLDAAKLTVGTISNVVAASGLGNRIEYFNVESHVFRLDPLGSKPGFHRTHVDGSILENGLPVRIHSVGEIILKIDICKPS